MKIRHVTTTICDKNEWPTHYFTLIYLFSPFLMHQCCFWNATVSANTDLGEAFVNMKQKLNFWRLFCGTNCGTVYLLILRMLE